MKKGGWVYVVALKEFNQAEPNVQLGNRRARTREVENETPIRMSRACAEILIGRGLARKHTGRVELEPEPRPSHAPEVSSELSDLMPTGQPPETNADGDPLVAGDVKENGEEVPDGEGTVSDGWGN